MSPSLETTVAAKKDTTGSALGMWLFLYTEIMLFGGLFIMYTAYYREYALEFMTAGKEVSLAFGAANTVILLCSSCAVACSITALRRRSAKLAITLLSSSVVMGMVFLLNKYFEWQHKIEIGIYPNSARLTGGEHGVNIFFGLYYLVTGLHGLHVAVGTVLLAGCALMIRSGRITALEYGVLDNCGLYWHLVDLIWIFVFPLFYLVV